ncbi:hypothetical protein GBA52_009390 [Prunus armeniaca]|nr:hypothetical protein GBA52_009390 [Prunus armeniaca]
MWKLKVADGGNDPYIYSTNDFVGRQIFEFDPEAGTPEERAEVEEARLNFYNNRYQVKPSGDLLWRMQFLKEKNFKQTIPPVKVEGGEEITYEKATASLRRSVHFFSALQASDGHWPAENAGPLFFLPPLVMCTYITGHLNTVFPAEHRKEILRYIYYHQNQDGGWGLHIEGHSTMFCTALSYICMRILGEGPDGGQDNACARARKWILDHGSVTHMPSWGKTWLSSFGSQQWDTGFAIQALLASNLTDEIGPTLARGHDFIKKSQVKDNPSGDFKSMHRHISKGSWTFSDQDHGWQVSDCTAEGLKCCLLLSTMRPDIVGEKMEPQRLYDSVNVLLSLQLTEIFTLCGLLQEITGVFMKNCMLHYAAYRNIYPLWALAEYREWVPLPSKA